jgi:hypothetical protein
MLGRRSVHRSLVLIAAVAALTFAFAANAFAAAPNPMSFTDLRDALAAAPSHHLDGYMKTIVDSSQEPTTIPLTVLAVPPSGTANTSLILFEAKGPLIAKYGGIVAGMSGSPVYLNNGKLIGAVSYGDYFTLGGTGLATPIEAMAQLESIPSSGLIPLSTPILTTNGAVNKIIVAPNPEDYAGAAQAGAFVAKPLASIFIGGMRPESAGYKALAKDLAARGLGVVQLGSPLVSGGGDEAAYSAEMTSGASIAALVSRGDLWVGGVGTVTYTDDDNVLAFGHPAYWRGASSYYMANAWIEDIWPSSYEPYKIGDPGKIRGTITQDRSAGILGKLDSFPAETTITAHAVDVATGKETSSAVYIPRALIRDGFADSSLVAFSAYMAGANLFDQQYTPGSAHTTTTVDVSDGTHVYHVSMPNYVDSTNDIPSAAVADAQMAIAKLQSVLQWGTQNHDLEVLSVDVTGSYSSTRAGGQIVSISAPNGLHVGANHVTVSAVVYAEDDTQTIDATVTIPAGTSLSGTLVASALMNSYDESTIMTESGMSLTVDGDGNYVPAKRKTIAEIAAELNKSDPDTAFKIAYQPGGSSEYDPYSSAGAVTTVVRAPWPVLGSATLGVTSVMVAAQPSVLSYGDYPDIIGFVSGPSAATVSLYARPAGSLTETLIDTQAATVGEDGLEFDFALDETFTNTTYRVHVQGTETWSGADASVTLPVRAMVGLGTSASRIRPGRTVKLTASVYPASAAGGGVVFERLSGKKWVKITSKTLAASGSSARASYTWKPGKGTQKVRARYLGGTMNYGNSSSTKTITVK